MERGNGLYLPSSVRSRSLLLPSIRDALNRDRVGRSIAGLVRRENAPGSEVVKVDTRIGYVPTRWQPGGGQ